VDEGPDEAAPEAPVFVLLHGNYTWSFLFRNLIGRLKPKCRVVAPDMIGFGLSDKPVSPAYHTLRQHLSNFVRVIEALELRDVTLVLHGWGGPIGLAYAAANPRNVSGLVLVNTWSGLPPRTRRPRWPLGLRIAAWGRAGQWLDAWLNLSINSAFGSWARRPVRDMALEAYAYPFYHRASRAAIAALSRMFAQPDQTTIETSQEITAGLGNITAPAHILCGAQDPVFGKLPAYWLRDQLKRSREPVFLSEVGHYLPEEAPDILAETVLRTQQPGTSRQAKERLFKILP
jgi:haloalkane dehalogenase